MTEKVVEMGSIEIGYEEDNLTALGLGSCVGVTIYDAENKIGGMAHIMLPNSLEIPTMNSERKCLVAEKEISLRNQIKDILRQQDFEWVRECQNKEEAIRINRSNEPTIAFISAFLPPEEDHGFIQTMQNDNKDLKIIILSPVTKHYTVRKYLESGAHDVLIAPFTEANILSITEYSLNKSKLKFADVAVKVLVQRMINRGAKKENLRAKIVGGAHMFPSLMDEEVINIGNKNIHATKKALLDLGIPIESEETGASIGRTVIFEIMTGKLRLRTKEGMHEI